MAVPDFAQILYSVDGGHTWHYGKSVEGWVLGDKGALRLQRQAVCQHARVEHGNVERVTTRIDPYDVEGNPL